MIREKPENFNSRGLVDERRANMKQSQGKVGRQSGRGPLVDSRTPDIIVAPNVGVVYTGGKAKVAEHGGFAYDDRDVLLIVSNPSYKPATFNDQVETRQIAPTIGKAERPWRSSRSRVSAYRRC
ncbi:MAG: hypothetical protein ACLPTQ_22895 [Terriglobales bacterium]